MFYMNAMTPAPTSQPDLLDFSFVLFGGTGDLAMRKILPALYAAHRDGMLAPGGKILAVAITALDCNGYLAWVEEHVKPRVPESTIDDAAWLGFLGRISYVRLDAAQP